MPNRTITREQVENPERLQRLLRDMAEEMERLRKEPPSLPAAPAPERNVLSGVGSGPAALVKLGVDVIATKKSNLEGLGAPAVTDDNSKGYAVGSVWINANASPKTIWMLAAATTSAAEWIQIG